MKRISQHLKFECINTQEEIIRIHVIFCQKSKYSDETDKFFIFIDDPKGTGWLSYFSYGALINSLINPPEKVKELATYFKWHNFSIEDGYMMLIPSLKTFYSMDLDFFKEISLFGTLKDDVLPDVDNVEKWAIRRLPNLIKIFERDMETYFGKI